MKSIEEQKIKTININYKFENGDLMIIPLIQIN